MTPSPQLHPWNRGLWQRWQAQVASGRVPHALLFTGVEGMGQLSFAYWLAQGLFCEQPATPGEPCGQCQACHLFAVGTHPDFMLLAPEEGASQIKIDQVRSLCSDLTLSAQYGGYKVAVIEPAEAMNVNAANSLLKTLEEPTPGAVMILVCAQPQRLPATIRSRCQGYPFGCSDEQLAEEWLRQQGVEQGREFLRMTQGAPLAALAAHEGELDQLRQARLQEMQALLRGQAEAVAVAPKWVEQGDIMLDWAQAWLSAMVRYQAQPPVEQDAEATALSSMAEGLLPKRLFELYDRLLQGRRIWHTQINRQLFWEEMLIFWSDSR